MSVACSQLAFNAMCTDARPEPIIALVRGECFHENLWQCGENVVLGRSHLVGPRVPEPQLVKRQQDRDGKFLIWCGPHDPLKKSMLQYIVRLGPNLPPAEVR